MPPQRLFQIRYSHVNDVAVTMAKEDACTFLLLNSIALFEHVLLCPFRLPLLFLFASTDTRSST